MARRILKEHQATYIDEKTKAELDRLAIAQQNACIAKAQKG